MIDVSGLKLDNFNLSAKLKFGGDKKIIQAENINFYQIIDQQYAGVINSQNPDLIAEKAEELISSKNISDSSILPNVELVLSPYMGIVKSPNLPGTRVHLEYTITNNNDIPITVKGLYAKIQDDNLHFKLFFSISDKGSRSPDLSIRLPILVGRKNGMRIAVELEDFEKQLIKHGQLNCALFVLIGNSSIISQKFTFDVNEAMINTLNILQAESESNNGPLVFDAMVKS